MSGQNVGHSCRSSNALTNMHALPTERDTCVLAKTNIYRFYTSIEAAFEHKDRDGQAWIQIAQYFKGVGATQDGIKKYLGGAFGVGISDQIKQAYAFLSENFQDPETDEIWLLGASRGGGSAL